MRLVRILLFISLIFTINLFSQDIYSIQAMQLFNEGNYKEAISLFNNYAQNYQSERGKAYYFIGESYYNLSFDDEFNDLSTLDSSKTYFEKAVKESDIEGTHYNPQYKKAWCIFRSAELSSNPVSYLIISASEFSKISETADKMIYYNSRLMAAESYLRLAQHLSFESEPDFDNIINFLNSSENVFNEILTSSDITEKKEIITKIRKYDVILEEVKINLMQNNIESATDNLNKINYGTILSGIDHQLHNQFKHIIHYSELYKLFYTFLINPNAHNRNTIISALENLSGLSGEKYFINSLTDFIYEGSRQLNDLTNINETNYEHAAQLIPDAWYWLGWLQFLNNNNSAIESFDQYRIHTDRLIKDARINFLRESAYYRKLLIEFDNNVTDHNALSEINNDLDNFKPENFIIVDEKNSLHSLVKVCLGYNIDQIVQTQGIQISTRERRNRVINLVQKMLERATKVVGRERGNYLNHIDNLLHYLNVLEQRIENAPTDLKEQIIFYNGLRLFLKAEIQPSQEEKRGLYIEAADELGRLSDLAGKYENEGNYIRARSFFEAARNSGDSRQQNKLFDNAKEIFIHLINEHHSLRSTYYLSEIFRLRQNFAASSQCYEIIKEKISTKEKNNFWYVNADAGLDRTSNLKDTGNLNVINNVDISNIIYPERLLEDDEGNIISMERFADSDFLKQEYFKTALKDYKKYGLPKKNFYPSINSYKNSIFTRRIYSINVGIQERMGELFSDFVLEIISPDHIVYNPSVLLDSLTMNSVGEYIFSRDSIRLNTSHTLTIKNPDCYPYYRNIQFIKPGIKRICIKLQPVLSYMSTKLSINEIFKETDVIDLRKRNDWNILFLDKLDNNKEIIVDDFKNNINFRDAVYSDLHKAFFAVRDDTSYLVKYQNNSKINFHLNFGEQNIEIFTPEGITVDSKGNFYIVNWAAHQIFILDSNGNYLKTIGEFGKNNRVGSPVKLTYPTRISILKNSDTDGNIIFYIADRYGIKIIDSNGYYLDTIIKVPAGEEGIYYDLHAKGYDHNIILYAVNRKNRNIEKYVLTEQY